MTSQDSLLNSKLIEDHEQRHAAIQKVLNHRLFFVCGAPKSGTTWVQRLLDTHPEIVCAGEGHFTDSLYIPLTKVFKEYYQQQNIVAERVFEGKPYYRGLQPEDLDFVIRSLIGTIMSQRNIPKDTRCIGDKTPRYTFHLNILSHLFPEAKFIHVIRDGRDVVTSTCHHAYRAGYQHVIDKSSPEYLKYTKNMAKVWVDNVNAATQFQANNSTLLHSIHYENLHIRAEETLDGLFRFLDVSSNSDIITTCISENEFKKQSGGRNKGEEKKSSFFRSGQHGGWKDFLTEAALDGVYKHAEPLLKKLKYLEK